MVAYEYKVIIIGIYAPSEYKNTLTKSEFNEKLNEIIV
jgi:hypothetical protein